MTRDELLEPLRAIKENDKNGDAETWHYEADTLLLEFINDPEIARAYDAIEKWYA